MIARLVFENGTVFEGTSFTNDGEKTGEVVFNTALTGYQEVITDPSYCGQIVLMTYPLIGSYGINKEDVESRGLFLSALIVREYIDFPSNWRSEKTLKSYLDDHHILGVENMDTRAITRFIREKGAQKAILTTSNDPISVLMQKAASSKDMMGQNLAQEVSCKSSYQWPSEGKKIYRVAVIDCGVKYNILRQLSEKDCACQVFPYNVSAETILEGNFDGVFLSNGPGDPDVVHTVIDTIKGLLGKCPIFGICLGHQLLGLALGGQRFKLKFGHHGANHPVKNLKTGQVEISSQNHGFCLDAESFNDDDVELTHINLNDNTVEGLRHKTFPAFSVQYHPEAAPGPHDSQYLFDEFISMMKTHKKELLRAL